MAERVFPAIPAVIGGGRILPSPSQFYLTGEDRLRIVCANALPGVTVKVQWRTATLQGDTVPNSQTHVPNSDRTVTSQDYELGAGSLLNVTAFAASGAPRMGQTFVMVQLVRGFGAAAIVLGTLVSGYITATQAVAFPGSPFQNSLEGAGYIRTLLGTTPGAGLDVSETVPAGARWELLAFTVSLQTTAAGVARNPRLTILTGAAFLFFSGSSLTGAPNSLTWHSWGQGMTIDVPLSVNIGGGGIPGNLALLAGQVITTATANLLAGDQFTAPTYSVREWLEVG